MSKGFYISPAGLTDTMYLCRATNCTYFTRICFTKSLKDRGFPFDIKVSLLTKVRSVAKKLNLVISLAVLDLIEGINSTTSPDSFRLALHNKIKELRDEIDCEYPVTLITLKSFIVFTLSKFTAIRLTVRIGLTNND
jgi:hypothetical protein